METKRDLHIYIHLRPLGVRSHAFISVVIGRERNAVIFSMVEIENNLVFIWNGGYCGGYMICIHRNLSNWKLAATSSMCLIISIVIYLFIYIYTYNTWNILILNGRRNVLYFTNLEKMLMQTQSNWIWFYSIFIFWIDIYSFNAFSILRLKENLSFVYSYSCINQVIYS